MFQRHPVQNQQMMFITTNTKDRLPVFSDPAYAREAVESLFRIQYYNTFFLYAFVVMADHCHLLLNVPEGGFISKVMAAYKRAVSFEIGKPVWQDRFHIKIPRKIAPTIEYIHLNPVRAGYCQRPEQYPWSSASGRWDVLELPMT